MFVDDRSLVWISGVVAACTVVFGCGDDGTPGGAEAGGTTPSETWETSSGSGDINPGASGVSESETSPSAPQSIHFVVARFDDGALSWSLVGPPDEKPTEAALDPNGDVLLSLRPDEQFQDARVVRVSEGGLIDEVALPANTWLTSIAVDAAGTTYVAGLFDDRSGYMAFDAGLDEHWPLTTGGRATWHPVGLALGPDGSVVYAGWSDELEAPILSRLGNDGVVQWTTPRPGASSAPPDAGVSAIAVHPDGTVALALATGGEDSAKLWLDVFAPDGSPSWSSERDSTITGGIAVSAGGAFVVSGYEVLFEEGLEEHLWLGSYDTGGAEVFSVLSENFAFGPIAACADGVIAVRERGLRATVFDAQGQPGETVAYEGEGFLKGTAAFCTADGGIVLVGTSTVDE